MNLLQVKSAITKHVLSRDIGGHLKPNERRHSLHYSHKRIRKPNMRKSEPKLAREYLKASYERPKKKNKRRKLSVMPVKQNK